MASNMDQEQDAYRGGYAPQQAPPPYEQNEMPQSSYPQEYPPYQSPNPEGPYPYQYQQQQQYEQPYERQYGQQYEQPYGQQYERRQQQYGYVPTGDVSSTERTGMGMKARTAGWMSYVFGWVTGLIFFLLEKENRFVRFHAMQSILFFGSLTLLQGLLSPFAPLQGALGFVMFIGWIVLMVNAGKGRYYKLPIIGNLAERLANQIK